MNMRELGQSGLTVSVLGLNCMGMSANCGAPHDNVEMIRPMRDAVDHGVTFFDTAEVYGPCTNEELVRDSVVIATKFGFDIYLSISARKGFTSKPAHVRQVVEASFKRLCTDVLDLLYEHRVDPATLNVEVAGILRDLINEGKVMRFSLSEASVVGTIRKAHAVQPVAAVQSAYSLLARDPEAGVLSTCQELGIDFVPWSLLVQAFLTSTAKSHRLEEIWLWHTSH